jgi:hypothetical protein
MVAVPPDATEYPKYADFSCLIVQDMAGTQKAFD